MERARTTQAAAEWLPTPACLVERGVCNKAPTFMHSAKEIGVVDTRFRRHWETWEALKAAGRTPADFLSECADETLVELLACQDKGTAVERNIIATELTNRLSRHHQDLHAHAKRIRELLDQNDRARARARKQSADAADASRGVIDRLDEMSETDRGIREETDRMERDASKTSRYTGDRERRDGW